MAVSGKSRTFASSKHRKLQKLKDNKPSRRAARQHTWRAFFILGGSGIFVHYRLFLLALQQMLQAFIAGDALQLVLDAVGFVFLLGFSFLYF